MAFQNQLQGFCTDYTTVKPKTAAMIFLALTPSTKNQNFQSC